MYQLKTQKPSLYGVFNIHTVVLSQSVFQSSLPASQCHQKFLIAGSPGLSTTITDLCLIRKMGCTEPEDITENGVVMGCLLIVILIKFKQLKRRLLCGPNPIMVGSTPEHTSEKHVLDEGRES